MKTKIMKPLIRGGFILLCLSILGSLLSSSSVLAQEPDKKIGGLKLGGYDYVGFQMKVGEMIQGELECSKALRVVILDADLRVIVDFGNIVGSFFYAAKAEGVYRVRMTNPAGVFANLGSGPRATETVRYTLTYSVLPTSLAPGTNSVTAMAKITRSLPVIITVLALGGITYLFILRRKKKKRELEQKQAEFKERIKPTE